MRTTCTNVRGNHGRGANNTTEANTPRSVGSTIPQQGDASLSRPTYLTTKKTISIGDVISDQGPAVETPKTFQAQVQTQNTQVQTVTESAPVATVPQANTVASPNTPPTQKNIAEPASEPVKPLTQEEQQLQAQKELEDLNDDSENADLYENNEILDDDDRIAYQTTQELQVTKNDVADGNMTSEQAANPLTANWNAMLANVFAQKLTILYPLKNHPPVIKDNILHVKVKGNIQKDDFIERQREVLAFWRNNVDEKIEGIEVETDETMEAPKIIYDNTDKMNHFNEENPEFNEFLRILDLKIKD